MASKKKGQLTQHCRIFQWIEDRDPVFAEAFRHLCVEGALSPGATGVTFLYPEDAAYRQEIVDKAYSDDADKAVKMMEALIIPDLFTQSSDFNRRAVGTRSGVALNVESVGDGCVTFAGGLTIVPAKFTPLGDRRIAVWQISKGRAPLEGKAYAPPAPARRPFRTGGCEGPHERRRLANSVEAEFDSCMRGGRGWSCNPYLAKTVSLLNYLKAERPDILDSVLPVLDYEPIISFYLLVEPYKSSGEYLIPTSVLFGDRAWNCAEAYSDAVAEYEGFFAAAASPQAPFMYRDRVAVARQIDNVRTAVNNKSPRDMPKAVKDAYDTFASQNAIAGMSPIMSPGAFRALANKKLWQDEFRFTIHEALQEMRSGAYDPRNWQTIVQDLRETWPGNNYVAELSLTNADERSKDVAHRMALLLLGKFVNSSDFLYLPMPPDMASRAWGGATDGMGDASDWSMYNRNAVALENLRRVTGMARADGISPQAMQELSLYIKKNGRLPPAVASMAPSMPGMAPSMAAMPSSMPAMPAMPSMPAMDDKYAAPSQPPMSMPVA